jgi:four helix bundle protein
MREGLDALEDRTKAFTVAVIKLSSKLENLTGLRRVTWQLIDAAGSVGANHRAMRRARSNREFSAKLQIVNEEVDESVFWLEVCQAVHPTASPDLSSILQEGIELRSIFAKARSTMRLKQLANVIAVLSIVITVFLFLHY